MPDHVHPYEAAHSHASPHESHKAPQGIVCLSSYDGMNQSFGQLTMPSITVALKFPEAEDNPLNHGSPPDEPSFSSAFISVPKQPPRL